MEAHVRLCRSNGEFPDVVTKLEGQGIVTNVAIRLNFDAMLLDNTADASIFQRFCEAGGTCLGLYQVGQKGFDVKASRRNGGQ
jgi:hypothetical protein